VLSLRGAGLLSRCYAWLSLLVLLAAAAGADTLHSVDVKLPHREAAATAAIIPWALLLIGFGLLLAMLRHARLRRAAAAARDAQRARAEPPAPAPAMAALPAGTAAQADRSPDPQQRSFRELPPASDEADEVGDAGEVILAAPAEPLVPEPLVPEPLVPEPLVPQPRAEELPGADQPRETAPFHRMWSTPTPPDDEG
jgi:hypothetical protein